MGTNSSAIQEIKDRLDIANFLANRGIALQKAGKYHKCLCPLHSEKTPSFTIYGGERGWYCYGCKIGGDIFVLYQQLERCPFVDALTELARLAGVTLESDHDIAAKNSMIELVSCMAGVWHSEYLSILAYLEERQITDESARSFLLGHAPLAGSISLMGSYGYPVDKMKEAGLVSDNGRELFAGRLIFPIVNSYGNVVAFGGRVLDHDQPKYINSPNTSIFQKRRSIYGINLAQAHIKDSGIAIVVEGYLDVIQAHQNGFRNVVSCMGTAITEEQYNILSRWAKKIIIVPDGDSGGVAMVRQSISNIPSGLTVLVGELFPGDDPDSAIRHSPDAFRTAITHAVGIVEWGINDIVNRTNIDELSDTIAGVEAAVALVASYDIRLMDHYVDWIMSSFNARHDLVKRIIDETNRQGPKAHEINTDPERALLALLVANPDYAQNQPLDVSLFLSAGNRLRAAEIMAGHDVALDDLPVLTGVRPQKEIARLINRLDRRRQRLRVSPS